MLLDCRGINGIEWISWLRMFEPHHTARTNGGRILQPANQPVAIELVARIPKIRAFARPEMLDLCICRFGERMARSALRLQFRAGRLCSSALCFDGSGPHGESESCEP